MEDLNCTSHDGDHISVRTVDGEMVVGTMNGDEFHEKLVLNQPFRRAIASVYRLHQHLEGKNIDHRIQELCSYAMDDLLMTALELALSPPRR